MNLGDYQQKAITTKIYDDSVAIPYVVLGICGEAAELYEKVSDQLNGKDVSMDLLGKEAADIVWYLAAWADETGTRLDSLVMNYAGWQPLFNTLEESLEKIILFSGQLAEYTKKALRDNFDEVSQGQYPKSKLDKAHEAVANLYLATREVVWLYGLNLDEILQQNIDKLASRAERGVLGGSGDNR